ncbi:MAG: carboxypeptidase regulatory-like domain-containing protein [Christensenellaceae bacterium]
MKKKKLALLLVVILVLVSLLPMVALADDEPLLNLKFYLIDKDSTALPGYILTIDNETQSVANKDGILSFPAVDASKKDTFKIFTPDKKQIGACNMTYVKSDKTGIADSTVDGDYTLNYSTPNATVYIAMVANPNGSSTSSFHPALASDNPITPGKQPPKPAPTKKPDPVTNPVIAGFLIDTDGAPIVHATIDSENDATKQSLSGVTDAAGYFVIPGISKGRHDLNVYDADGESLGDLEIDVVVGDNTQIVKKNGKNELDLKAGLGTIYINMQMDGKGDIVLLDASSKPLNSPATAETEPTETPQPLPSIPPIPDTPVDPASEQPAEEETVEPAPEEQETTAPAPAEEQPTTAPAAGSGISSNMLIIILVVIIAVAAIVITVILTRRKRQ